MNIKTNLKTQKGFTIVELLIVIVVIGILAGITIVAYNGVTARANKTSAQATASSVINKIEAYNAELATYPLTSAAMTGATGDKSYYIPAGINFTSDLEEPDASNGKNTVRFLKCAASVAANQAAITTASGASIGYYDFVAGSVVEVTTGDATSCPTS